MGYRIGPTEVESALMEHPAVLETSFIGKPDPVRTELVKAFVVLKDGYKPSAELCDEISLFVKRRPAAHTDKKMTAEMVATPAVLPAIRRAGRRRDALRVYRLAGRATARG